MAIRLWPKDYERKDHITKAEKNLLRYAARNFQNGHIAVGIDPVGLSNETTRMGMYISLNEGLITFSIYPGKINAMMIPAYIGYAEMVEQKIYERLLDSKLLIVRNGDKKALKFPYKHIVIFPEESIGKVSISADQLKQLYGYATFDAFRPITSDGKEKRIEDLRIFDCIRKAYDHTFKSVSDIECRAVFERLAPEYTVVMNETLHVRIDEKKTLVTEKDLLITGQEQEFKTFFLDEYQVGIVNDMGKGHRVILANPGAGKSVLLLSKAFKYASLYKGSNVLLACYNNNLADSYNFKRNCANFGENNNLFIMTFHKLVKKIYEECLHSHCASNIATEEEIQKCIDLVKQGKIKLRFKAIFIDEVQIFDPLYLELCYRLLEDDDDRVFLMAGDLNQAVRALSRKGDAPWKRMNGIQLDFKGRVRYIEKNYRNSKDIGEYIASMLQHMNNRLTMLDLINSLEYEYNSFKVGSNPTIALNVQTGVNRMEIKARTIAAVKEIAQKYRISYSEIAVLFPFRQVPYHNYRFLYWLKQGLDDEGIPYSMIINEDNMFVKKRQGDISGVVISTIESSLGLDFKAVVLTGLFPYGYVNTDGVVGDSIKSWSGIKAMDAAGQASVQSQMRAIYTACSRARDVLYVISDIKSGTPMEEIIKRDADRASLPAPQVSQRSAGKNSGNVTRQNAAAKSVSKDNGPSLPEVIDHVTIKATILDTKKDTSITVDLKKYPKQKGIIGKKVGETFKLEGVPLTYRVDRIIPNGAQPQTPTIAPSSKVSQSAGNTTSLASYFQGKGFKVVDCRPNGGCLWVIGEKKQLEPYVLEAARLFRANGAYGSGKATSYKSGWWTKSNK
ncbi:MAG: AAA family ATPase [Oscillospiraceae bacterium]|nr:AAA family ATPase [Oscillospiraceae bacterium]